MPPTLFNNELKNKAWSNYQYELDEARSPAEKKAARKEYDAIIADGMRQKEENDKKKAAEPEVRKWEVEEKPSKKEAERVAREEKQRKEHEEKRKVKNAEKTARKEKKAAEADARASWLRQIGNGLDAIERGFATHSDDYVRWYLEPEGPGSFDHGITSERVSAVQAAIARLLQVVKEVKCPKK